MLFYFQKKFVFKVFNNLQVQVKTVKTIITNLPWQFEVNNLRTLTNDLITQNVTITIAIA